MNKNKFKIGDIVKCTAYHEYGKGQLGKIIDIRKFHPPYIVEFFKPVKDGHNGWGLGNCDTGIGKNPHCRWLEETDLKLYPSILKLFLKEKNDKINKES